MGLQGGHVLFHSNLLSTILQLDCLKIEWKMKAFHSKRSLISEISPLLSFYNAAHPRCFGSFAQNPAKCPEAL